MGLKRTIGISIGAGLLALACAGYDADRDGYYTDPALCGMALYDCDDSDPSVGHGQYYFADCDADGLGDQGNIIYLCSEEQCGEDGLDCPAVSNALDCNDRPPNNEGAGIPLYPDCDLDGLGDASRYVIYCPDDGAPPDQLGTCPLVLNGDDCQDNAAIFNEEVPKVPQWFDCDGDSYGDDVIGPMYLCPDAEAVPGATTIKVCQMVGRGGDCDDQDPEVNDGRENC